MIKKTAQYVGGAALGFASNRIIEKSTAPFWKNQAQKIVDQYNKLVASGMSEDEAADKVIPPLWKKLGSRRFNALGTIALGSIVMAAKQKNIGKGIIAAGLTKFLFPNFTAFVKDE